MKKRLISILLTVLMVMSLFSGMSLSAYADDAIDSSYYTEYTLVQGDYVLRICQRMGINYYTCKEAIMRLNNIASENGFRFLSVGANIKIPVSDAHAIAIMSGKAPSAGSGSGNGTADVSGKDSIAYYLIPYTMQRGETVLGVCNSLGIDFNKNDELIQAVNGIKAWKGVKAGETILLPTTKVPAVGTTCYAVVGHKVASGETAYNICQNNGINYGSNTKLLEALNNSKNLANLKAGKTFYMAVPTTIKANSTVTDGNNSGSGSTSTDKNNGTSGSTSTENTKLFDINANINTTYGTMKFYVNNKSVETAAEGAKVTVDVTTVDNRAVESLIVKFADGRADVKLESNTFIMPGCDVRVDANINSGYNIKFESNNNFKLAATVDGISVSSAAEDKSVKVVCTDPSYEITSIKVIKANFMGIKKEVPVNDNNSFVMPDHDVLVKVEVSPVKTYNFYRDDCENGSFDIQVDGFSVSKAAKGAKVTVVWQPASGFDIKAITVTNRDTKNAINVFNNSFTMPASDVDVKVEFEKATNHIEIEAITGAILRAYLASDTTKSITEANTGEAVLVKAIRDEGKFEADDGYNETIKSLAVTRKADGHRVNVELSSDKKEAKFTMPAGGVIITGAVEATVKPVAVEFYSVETKAKIEDPAYMSGNSVTLTDANDRDNYLTVKDNSSETKKEFAVGTKIKLSTDTTRDAHKFVEYKVFVGDSTIEDMELTKKANQGQFTMPNDKVIIRAYFEAQDISIPAAETNGRGAVSYMVSHKGGAYNSATVCKVGDLVKIVPVANDSKFKATLESVTVIDNESKDKLVLTQDGNNFVFQMPPSGVTIKVDFVGVKHTVTLLTRNIDDAADLILQGKSLVQFNNGSTGTVTVDNTSDGTKVEVLSGTPVGVLPTEQGKASYTVAKVEITGHSGVKYEQGIEYNTSTGFYGFYMEDEDMTVTVWLKQKAATTFSLKNLSYPAEKLTADATVLTNGSFVSANECKVGDVVYIQTNSILDPYYVERDGLRVVRNKDNGSLGIHSTNIDKGSVGTAVINDGDLYPVKDGDKVVGWMFKMPEGGIKSMDITAKAQQFNIELKVVDTDNNTLTDKGLVQMTFNRNDTQVNMESDFTKVDYKSSVAVALTRQASDKYTLKLVSVDVEGVTVSNNSFTMPGKDAVVTVTVEDKTSPNSPFALQTNYTNGTLQFATTADKKVLYNGKANAGDMVYIFANPNTGYELNLSTFKVLNAKNNESVLQGTPGNYYFTMPEDGVKITAEFKKSEYKLKATFDASANELLKVSIDNKTYVLSNGTEITVTYDSSMTFSMNKTDTYKLVNVNLDALGIKAVDKHGNVTVKMPAKDMNVIDFGLVAK